MITDKIMQKHKLKVKSENELCFLQVGRQDSIWMCDNKIVSHESIDAQGLQSDKIVKDGRSSAAHDQIHKPETVPHFPVILNDEWT